MIKSRVRLCLCTIAVMLLAFLFVPAVKTEAAGLYYLQVNKGTNVVTVFGNDGVPVKSMICSTGEATPTGIFYTSQKYRWHTLVGPSYGQYCTRITGPILFHSVFYNRNGDPSSMPYEAYNQLGMTASHGCVRLTVADAKWIYDNCPLQTRVIIINGAPFNDPLGKPEAIKVNTGAVTGWDPTDPMPENPYAGAMPWISVDGVQKDIAYNSSFSPLNGVTAYDSLGNNITYRMTYSGKVNTKKLGNYSISYFVTDALGRNAQTTVTYRVVDVKKAAIKGVKKEMIKQYGDTVNLRKNVTAKTVTGKNLTKKIQIKIIYPNSKKEKIYKKDTIRLTKLGTYKINYYVTNPNNKKVTKITCKVTVKDTKAPVLKGISSARTAEYQSKLNLISGVKANLRSGKDVRSRLEIKVLEPDGNFKKLKESAYKKYRFERTGVYYVEYSVSNPYNKRAVARKGMKVTVKDTKAPKIQGTMSVMQADLGDGVNLLRGVRAQLVSGRDITSQLQINVKDPKNTTVTLGGSLYIFEEAGTYEVQYIAKNPYNSKAVTTKTMRVNVLDNRNIWIIIREEKTSVIPAGQPYGVYENVSAQFLNKTAVSQITAQIQGTAQDGTPIPEDQIPQIQNGQVIFTQPGTYTITYTAVNPNNPKKTAQRIFTVTVTE